MCVFTCRGKVWITRPSKEVVRSLKRHWSKHAQARTHANSYFNKTPCSERAAGRESTGSTMRKQILADGRAQTPAHRRVFLSRQTGCLSESRRQSCRSSRAAFCVRGDARRFQSSLLAEKGFTALVTAACATSHMIPTVQPLFHKLNSYGDRRGRLKSSPQSQTVQAVPSLLI